MDAATLKAVMGNRSGVNFAAEVAGSPPCGTMDTMNDNETKNPCDCGCGKDAGYYKSSNRKEGIKAGDPKRFVKGHHNRFRKAVGPCSVDGCNSKRYSKGVCQPHYDRMRTRGTYGDPEGLVFNKGRNCSVDDCGRKERTKGMCEPHYRRFLKYGKPSAGRAISKRRDLSIVPSGNVWCTRCDEIKPESEFYKNQRSCKDCHKIWLEDNRESAYASNRKSAHKKYHEAKSRGRCAWRSGRGCDQPSSPRRVYCSKHGAMDSARATSDYSTEYANRVIADCWICGVPFSDSVKKHNDHLIPQSKGGPNDVWNLAPACEYCNTSRGNEDLSETIKRAVYGTVAVSDFPEEYMRYTR